ncbi:MAG: dienelactone hydrolase, partial [Frankiales bacterium]|nr:dienelactone hydrolase [Frankiales bacterium]
DGSLAPAAPGAGQAGDQRALTLTAADGTAVLAHECRAASPATVGVVVLPDVRGLHGYYRDLTVRLAELGWESVAIDYFARTAPDDNRADDFGFWPHVKQAEPATIALDVQAGVEHLRSLGVERVFTIGFCFGGAYSWRQSADTPGLAGCIGFYGKPERVEGAVEQMQAPLLLLHAGADPNIPVEEVRQLADTAPVDADLVVFDGMPHSFFDRTSADHADACIEAWGRITSFVAAHAG